MEWADLAQELLDAADAAVAVDRAFVAPGPDAMVAFDCRSLAVWLEQPGQPPAPVGSIAFGACASIPQLTFRVAFRANCVPPPGDGGEPPDATATTEWSATFLDDVQRVHTALADACTALNRRCSSITLGPGQPGSPSPGGGTASMSWPITVVMA